MHLILTHEQADFDGVAACLAAYWLNPEAVPVLPRRLNRNVRAFLTLYGEELPFVRFEDLPSEEITAITLLDTKSLPSIRGASEATTVHVVDHHPLDGESPPGWSATWGEVGATTTLMVEELSARGIEPNMVSLTALLLGIYEDTGSLTYASTTSRDLLSSAWLLERGANLSIAADFLHHPLSSEQRDLYETLLESAESHEIQGLSIVVAVAKAGTLVDEISTLAHNLRDVFDPAGLFVLVEMNRHVQLVARSTEDGVDVARVAEQFGGGGHARAAAALIRGKSLESVRKALLELLPRVVQPPLTVAQIMSRGPQTFAPTVEIQEALRRMQRFGHEGYPVVSRGKVIGLLTRRQVDRAMSHGLGRRPVSSVMSAGEVTVEPGQSIQHLQRLMIDHDWGQVPVIDPEDQSVIGIVTRTDLIKTLAGLPPGRGRESIASRLREALPPSRYGLLKTIAQVADTRGDALYIVGGFVRDLILQNPSHDFDLVVEGDAIALAKDLSGEYGGKVSTHRRFGTAKWTIDRQSPVLQQVIRGSSGTYDVLSEIPATLDLVTARSEFYEHPSALPSIERGSIKLDLHRRDFTINTLAIRLDGGYFGQLLDHWGGGRDLELGLVRVLHSLSFVDDPTRMLRAVRLEQRLGFKIEDRTLQLLKQALPLLHGVSGDRVRSEFMLMLPESRLGSIMERLQELGLLAGTHESLRWSTDLHRRWEVSRDARLPEEWRWTDSPGFDLAFRFFGLLLSDLSWEDARAAGGRLDIPASMLEDILAGVRLKHTWGEWAGAPPSDLVNRFDQTAIRSLALLWADPESPADLAGAIDRFVKDWRHVRPYTDGNTLKERGLPPGPDYKRILDRLRDAWLDGAVNSQEEEVGLLDRLLSAANDEQRD